MRTQLTLLGGLTVKEFLRDYWQKKPLLIRQAIPGFKGLLSPQQLIELACSDDAQARLVTHKQWQLRHGPFASEDFSTLGKSLWTVLAQGVNHSQLQGAELLKQFSFIPHARLDDLMVSYAPKGGGVGPHFDAYDVFLLQGHGHPGAGRFHSRKIALCLKSLRTKCCRALSWNRSGYWSRATCSTCRRNAPTTALPKMTA